MLNLSTLNSPQHEAVVHGQGPLLVLAGAGSGKTRVVTCRIAYLIERGVHPSQIVGLTFTNKAASEMRERVADLCGAQKAKGVVLATFHSLCCRILRADIEPLGYGRDFSIFGESDQLSLLRTIFPKAEGKELQVDVKNLQTDISDAKNRLLTPTGWKRKSSNPVDEFKSYVYGRYQKALKAQNAVDFDDLIGLALTLFKKHPEVLARYQERWRFMMVDEYQDTNDAQHKLIRALVGEHQNICAVGDDDQSIYAWRGAVADHILNFEKQFPGATIVKLEQNYRSSPEILGASNVLISHNKKRYDKALWTERPRGIPVTLFRAEDGDEEARMVLGSIMKHHNERGVPFKHFAVLYRTNQQSKLFEEECLMHRIPFLVIGGQQYFDKKEVKDILAYLRLMANTRDGVSLRRIINTPRRGIGNTALTHLNEHARHRNVPVWDAVLSAADVAGVTAKTAEACKGFVDLIQHYRQRFRNEKRLAPIVEELIRDVNYYQVCLDATRSAREADKKYEAVEAFTDTVSHYESQTEKPSLIDFLETVTLDDDKPGSDGKKHRDDNKVRLMTLHSAKGLEFPFVYLVGLEEDLLPHARSTGSTDDLAEERRLLYVGMTRAQQQLVLTYTTRRRKHGTMKESIPSRFLKELPENGDVRRLV